MTAIVMALIADLDSPAPSSDTQPLPATNLHVAKLVSNARLNSLSMSPGIILFGASKSLPGKASRPRAAETKEIKGLSDETT